MTTLVVTTLAVATLAVTTLAVTALALKPRGLPLVRRTRGRRTLPPFLLNRT